MPIRRIHFAKERVLTEDGLALAQPICRAAALVVVDNPFAGKGHVGDLGALFDTGRDAGVLVMGELAGLLDRPAVAYGKAAIVGIAGAMEHGAACLHPKLGRPMREGIGGGKAIIPSNCKLGVPGTLIDVPLGHKDDVWSFAHFDTMTLGVPDAPRAGEIVIILALADGGRALPRVGDAPRLD